MKKKLFVIILSFIMMVTMMPLSVFADSIKKDEIITNEAIDTELVDEKGVETGIHLVGDHQAVSGAQGDYEIKNSNLIEVFTNNWSVYSEEGVNTGKYTLSFQSVSNLSLGNADKDLTAASIEFNGGASLDANVEIVNSVKLTSTKGLSKSTQGDLIITGKGTIIASLIRVHNSNIILNVKKVDFDGSTAGVCPITANGGKLKVLGGTLKAKGLSFITGGLEIDNSAEVYICGTTDEGTVYTLITETNEESQLFGFGGSTESISYENIKEASLSEVKWDNRTIMYQPIIKGTNAYALTLYHPAQHKVTFEMQGHGQQIESQEVYDGLTVDRPSDPQEPGYEFDGWYTEKECQNEFDFDTPINADTTLYAKWTGIPYAINKTTGEGVSSISAQVEGTEAEQATVGTTVSVSALPETTYQIQNITITPSDTTIEPIVITGNQGQFTMPASDVTITASVEHVAQHEVAFDMQGHGQQIESQEVYDGLTVDRPSDPQEPGYEFGGWYTEKECENEFDFATPIKVDTTLYAKWTAIPYLITKTTSEGVSSISAQVEGTEAEQATIGTTVSVSALPDTTYQIQNITITPSDTTIDPIVITGDQGQFTMPASGVIITATAEHVAQHEVAFDMQGHGQQIESQEVYDGLTVDRPSDPQEPGYEFGGWYTEKECENEFDFATPIKADTTLYAKWTINTYTVTFDVQGHGTAPDAQSVNYNDKAQKPADPSEEGYTFGGWYTEKECENEFDFATPIKADTTLYAKWTAIPYAINKTTSEGVSSISAQVEGTEAEHAAIGTTVSVSALPDTTYQIQNITITPSDTTIDPIVITGDQGQFTMPASDVTITASAEHVAQHEVTFDMQGHGQQIASQAVYDGQTVTKPEEPRERGYIFDGWFKEAGCENEFDFDTPITGDTVLYAKWTAVKVPQVTGLDAKVIDSKTASVTWNKVTGFDEVKYEVWRKAGDSGTFKKIATTTSNSYKDTKVITGTKYYYEVRAICTASGETYTGKFSNTDYAYPCLYQVTKLSAIALNAANIQLKWNANGNKNVVYQIYRSTKSDSGFAKVGTITDGKTNFSQSFTTAQSGKKYYYKVRAITKDYTGKWHYGTFSKVDYAYPRVATPTGFKAWASGKHTCNCSWNKVAGSNVKYLVYRGTKPTGNWGKAIATTNKTNFTNKNMKSGQKYYYMVRAVQTINGKQYYSDYSAKDYAYPR